MSWYEEGISLRFSPPCADRWCRSVEIPTLECGFGTSRSRRPQTISTDGRSGASGSSQRTLGRANRAVWHASPAIAQFTFRRDFANWSEGSNDWIGLSFALLSAFVRRIQGSTWPMGSMNSWRSLGWGYLSFPDRCWFSQQSLRAGRFLSWRIGWTSFLATPHFSYWLKWNRKCHKASYPASWAPWT